jgi:hypothetical protein
VIYTALDLASRTGVAWGVPFQQPACTAWELRGPSRGRRGLDLMSRLVEHLDTVRPDKVFIEKPLEPLALVRLDSTGAVVLLLNGLVMLAETVCASRGIPSILYDRQDVLAHFTGQAKYREKDGGKAACAVRCRQLWRLDLRWDEADACALWHLGCAREDPKSYALAGLKEPVRLRSRPVLRRSKTKPRVRSKA